MEATFLEECDKIIALVTVKKWNEAQRKYHELWHNPKMRDLICDPVFSIFIGILDLATRGSSEWDYLTELQRLRRELTVQTKT